MSHEQDFVDDILKVLIAELREYDNATLARIGNRLYQAIIKPQNLCLLSKLHYAYLMKSFREISQKSIKNSFDEGKVE